MDALETFRAEKDAFFAHSPESPLTVEQQRDFAGLSYFPENETLRLETSVDLLPAPERVEIQTSTGDVQVYHRYGRFRFQVEDQAVQLTIFEGPGGFFLPFVDSQAGVETYPAGRYLEPEQLEGGQFRVDFNLAYNPYCAYNEHWSCPITPAENRLKVPIRAGEKIFGGSHQAAGA